MGGTGSTSYYGNKQSLPSLGTVKNLTTFAEYPLNTLAQINEAYQYYCQSPEYANHIPVMAIQSFEETFGQLFPDPIVQFYALQQGQGNALLTAASAFSSAMMGSSLVRGSVRGSGGGLNSSQRVKKALSKAVVGSSAAPPGSANSSPSKGLTGSGMIGYNSNNAMRPTSQSQPQRESSPQSKPQSRALKERSKMVFRPQQSFVAGGGSVSSGGGGGGGGNGGTSQAMTTSSASERGGAGGSVVILDIFYIFTMFCDASIRDKLYYLCAINTDMDVTSSHLRLDALQLMIYRILQAVANVCRIAVPPREDVYSFLDYSIKQFIEMNSINYGGNNNNNNNSDNNSVSSGGGGGNGPRKISSSHGSSQKNANSPSKPGGSSSPSKNNKGSSNTTMTTTTTSKFNDNQQKGSFSFNDFWQWCQDVHQVTTFLDSIDNLCRTVMVNVDRSYKGRQYMTLRNSVLSSSFSMSGSIKDSLKLQQTLQDVVNSLQLQQGDIKQLALQYRHPVWKYSFRDMVDEHWFDDLITSTTVEDKMFTVLEHMILSTRKVIPVFAHPTVITNLNTALNAAKAAAEAAASGNTGSIGGSNVENGGNSGTATPSGVGSQRNSVSSNAGGGRIGSISVGGGYGSRTNSLAAGATGGNRYGSVSSSSKGSISFANTAANLMNGANAAGGASGQFGMNALVQSAAKDITKFQLIGVVDMATALSWIISCAPEKVLSVYKKKEEEERQKKVQQMKRMIQGGGDDEKEKEKSISSAGDDSKGLMIETSSPPRTASASTRPTTSNKDGRDREMSKDENGGGGGLDGPSMMDGLITPTAGGSTATLASVSGTIIGASGSTMGGSNNDRLTGLGGFRFKQRTKNVNEFRSQWQTMGEEIAYSPLFNVYSNVTFPFYHRRYDLTSSTGGGSATSHIYYLDQPLYNAIALFASGLVKYIPIGQNRIQGSHAPVSTAPNRILHVLEPYELAGFLYNHFDEFFIDDYSYSPLLYGGGNDSPQKNHQDGTTGKTPNVSPSKKFQSPQASPRKEREGAGEEGPESPDTKNNKEYDPKNHPMNRSIVQCGLMKEPVIIDSTVNIGTAFYILLKSKLDACLVLDDKKKVGCILTIYHVEKLWWSWKQQHLSTAMNVVTLSNLQEDYNNGVYNMFPTPVNSKATTGGAGGGGGTSGTGGASGGGGGTSIAGGGGGGALRDGCNFSLFSCFMNPLELGHSIGIEVIQFDNFVNDTSELEFDSFHLFGENLSKRSPMSKTIGAGLNTVSIATATTATTEDESTTVIEPPTPSRIFGQSKPATSMSATRAQSPPKTGTSTASGGGGGRPGGPPSPRPAILLNTRPGFGGRNIRPAASPRVNFQTAQSLRDKARQESQAKANRARRTEQWFLHNNCISPHDSLRVALYVMHKSKLSCTYVVAPTGEPLGLVTLQDVCKYIIQQEARQKAMHSDLVRRESARAVRRIATYNQ